MSEKDVELDEKLLLQLALQELKGKLPPGYQDVFESHENTNLQLLQQGPLIGAGSGQKTLVFREMFARGWDSMELSKRSGLSVAEVSALAKGSQKMTREIAQVLAKVFGTSSEFWF
jgi:hypothetical protein